MAKIQSATGMPIVGQVIEGLQINTPLNLGGNSTAQRPNNNRQSRSAKYTAMNNLVDTLDATFHGIPPGGFYPGATQGAWDQLAATPNGWQLCGCGKELPTGQKLFRQVNFNLSLIGQPINTTTPTAPWIYSFVFNQILFFNNLDPRFPNGEYNNGLLTDPFVIAWQLGLGLNNPISTLGPDPGFQPFTTADPAYPQIHALTGVGSVRYCMFYRNGLPAFNNGTSLVTQG